MHKMLALVFGCSLRDFVTQPLSAKDHQAGSILSE